MYVVISDDGMGESGGALVRISPAGTITRFAGGRGIGSEDGTGDAARFLNPKGFTVDARGNFFVADSANHAIRKITPQGLVTTVAGNSAASVDGGQNAARFRHPGLVAVDPAGNVFVSERGAIRKITADGFVTTLPIAVPMVDQSHFFESAVFLAVDGRGNGYVGDRFGEDRSLRKLSPGGVVTTLLTFGPGEYVSGLAVDRNGNVFYTVYRNDSPAGYTTVGRLSVEGVNSFLAGGPKLPGLPRASADGLGVAARFNEISGVAVNSRGEVFVSESKMIRRISPTGAVTTIAGVADQPGRQDGFGSAARFANPTALAVTAPTPCWWSTTALCAKLRPAR